MGDDAANSGSRDGGIDFSGYSLGQLTDLRGLLDRNAFPQNYANLLAEIEKRSGAASEAPAPPAEPPASADRPVAGRHSARDGWRGWAQSLRRRAPLFGAGELEISGDHVKLVGNRRTWLGVTAPGEYIAPLERVRNAAVDGSTLRFEVKRRFWPARILTFDTGSAALAHALLAQLPDRRSAGFESRWRETREFHARLNALGGNHWVTPALVAMNFAAFAAVLVASGSLSPDGSRLVEWGANYGPLTTSGQWWRALTSMFMHGSWAHLLLNMWVLWHTGRLAERLYGSATFAFLYFATGICGSFARTIWDPAIASVGSSGAIFGIVGALLAMLLHRNARIPRSIALAHWPSTLLFAAYNLVGGIFDPLIDNAVHVGGFLSGLVFGWVMVRPVDVAERRPFPARQVISAAVVLAVLGVGCFAHLETAGTRASVPERYLLDRTWYVRGEAESLQLWGEVVGRVSTGTISQVEMIAAFDEKIIPFWKSAQERLEREAPKVPSDLQPFDRLLREFVRHRLAWARELRDITRSRDTSRLVELAKVAKETGMALAALQRFNMRATTDVRPRALSNSLPVVKLRNLFSFDTAECVKPPEGWPDQLVFSDAPTDGPKALQKAGCQAQQYFVTGDYQALEDFIARSSASLGDLRDGSSTLSGIFGGLEDYFDYGGQSLENLLGRTSDWRRVVDDSVGAELAEVLLFRAWAWSARGTGGANSVSQQGWEIFHMRSEMAAAGLREMRDVSGTNPYWYALSLRVGIDQQLDTEKLDEIFSEAVARYPDYLSIYTGRMRSLMPRWGGSLGEVDAFIQSAADARRGTLGPDERYAQLYGLYTNMERDELNIFAAGNADWQRVQTGFDLLRRRYPRSDFIVNQYAKLACTAADPEKYQALRPLAAARRSSAAWSKKRSLESCDKMLRTKPGQS